LHVLIYNDKFIEIKITSSKIRKKIDKILDAL